MTAHPTSRPTGPSSARAGTGDGAGDGAGDDGGAAPVVLIEPNAGRRAGHWHHALTALGGASTRAIVVVLNGITPGDRAALAAVGARVVDRPPVRCAPAWVLLAAGRATARVSRILLTATRRRPGRPVRWPVAVRRLPHQITMVSRCLIEAASLRTGRTLAPGAPQVVLTASETLHAAAAAWGGASHLRIVHEVFTTEDAALRALGRTARRHHGRVLAVCPTSGVRDDLRRRFPELATTVMPFALTAPGDYLTAAERRRARADARAGIGAGGPVAVLVGGWWPSKDPTTVIEAFTRARASWTLIVAGAPVDRRLLQRLEHQPRFTLRTLARELEPDELRCLYAAADVAIVSRAAGAIKESGLLMDAVRHGVAVIISDHDPALAARLRTQPWARVFRTGDPDGLAAVLDEAAGRPPARPLPGDAARLGLNTPDQALARFTALHARLPHSRRTSP